MSYDALHEKKSLSAQFMAMAKSCTAIPTRASKVMHCQPQPRESSNIERKPFWLHLTQWDAFEKHMIPQFRGIYHTLMKR